MDYPRRDWATVTDVRVVSVAYARALKGCFEHVKIMAFARDE